MNFCQPEGSEKSEDDPKDWLISSLFFVGALGMLLQEGEGIVVHAKNDLRDMVGEGCFAVYRKAEQVVVSKLDQDLEDGTMLWMDEGEGNNGKSEV